MSSLSSQGITVAMIQYKESINSFTRGLPVALLTFPFINFMMHPSHTRGIQTAGALTTALIGFLFTNPNSTSSQSEYKKCFLDNYVSFYGMTIGYFAGYKFYISIHEKKLGNLLSIFLMTLIISLLVASILRYDSLNDVPFEYANILIGVIIGSIIGMFFSYISSRYNEEEKNKINHAEVVCNAYEDGNLLVKSEPKHDEEISSSTM